MSGSLAGCLGGEAGDEGVETAGEADADPGDERASDDGDPPIVVRNEATFEGIAPDPEGDPTPYLQTYAVTVPANATRIDVWHNATYTGNWPATVNLTDPSGERRSHTIEECDAIDGLVPPGQPAAQGSWSCHLDERARDTLATGDWQLRLAWQIGEVYEEYTLDVLVRGYPAESSTTR
jgi:hypothetical protein